MKPMVSGYRVHKCVLPPLPLNVRRSKNPQAGGIVPPAERVIVILNTMGPAHVVNAPISILPVPFDPDENNELGTVGIDCV